MNTLTEPTDPKTLATAYALDEMTTEERAAFEAQMENDPALAALVEETREFCSVLNDELAQPTAELQEAARARLLFEAGKAHRDAKVVRHRWVRRLTAMAACVAAGAVGAVYIGREKSSSESPRIASAPRPPSAGDLAKAGAEAEAARARMLDTMKKNGIVDYAANGSGAGSLVSNPSPEILQQAAVSQEEMAENVAKLRNQLTVLEAASAAAPADAQTSPVALKSKDAQPPDLSRTGLRPVTAGTAGFTLPPTSTSLASTSPAQVGGQMSGAPGTGGGVGGGKGTGRGYGIGSGGGAGIGAGWGQGRGAAGPLPGKPSGTDAYAFRSKVGDLESVGDGQERRDYRYAAGESAPGTESYAALPENPFLGVQKAPLSTFSIDVDTASYSNVRRYLNQNQAPPPEAVRLEELVNYFPYDYAQPVDGKPFAVHVEMTSAPWNAQHRLARIALKGKEIHAEERPAANLVFLVDVSGSMQPENKLPLVKQSLRFVVERLSERDTVALVTYAGDSGVALPATSGADKARIMAAIDGLGAGGSTNGAGGINAAYAEAAKHFRKEGINRVILATDGDFNVGVTSRGDLQRLIEEKRATGVFLSLLGYGMGNTKDDTMELLANKGNGNYAYIDSLSEARKALGEQFSGTLVTIAKDVKIQIEFNPAVIQSYRLLGYENRMLAKEDFNNDKKDAGEIGAGHTVTALYELVPVGVVDEPVTTVDGLKYQQPKAEPAQPAAPAVPAEVSAETMTVKLRWKAPDADVSQLMEVPVKDAGARIADASPETKWAVAVAGFASRLRHSQFAGMTWEDIRTLAKAGKGTDPNGYRGEFLQLLDKAESVRR